MNNKIRTESINGKIVILDYSKFSMKNYLYLPVYEATIDNILKMNDYIYNGIVKKAKPFKIK